MGGRRGRLLMAGAGVIAALAMTGPPAAGQSPATGGRPADAPAPDPSPASAPRPDPAPAPAAQPARRVVTPQAVVPAVRLAATTPTGGSRATTSRTTRPAATPSRTVHRRPRHHAAHQRRNAVARTGVPALAVTGPPEFARAVTSSFRRLPAPAATSTSSGLSRALLAAAGAALLALSAAGGLVLIRLRPEARV